MPKMYVILALFNAAKAAIFDLYFAVLGQPRLPPGKITPFQKLMHFDQKFLLEQSLKYGPIFKTMWSGQLVICITSNELGRKLLQQNESKLKGMSVDIRKFFQPGMIRNMQGTAHAECRHHLTRDRKSVV